MSKRGPRFKKRTRSKRAKRLAFKQKSGKLNESGDFERGLRRSLDAGCDLFLFKWGLKGVRGSFRFGGKR
jgi:hypothetical protein